MRGRWPQQADHHLQEYALTLWRQGKTPAQVAREISVPEKTFHRWIRADWQRRESEPTPRPGATLGSPVPVEMPLCSIQLPSRAVETHPALREAEVPDDGEPHVLRERAVQMLRAGATGRAVVATLGVSERRVYRWARLAQIPLRRGRPATKTSSEHPQNKSPRRLQGEELLLSGWRHVEVAWFLGVTKSAVYLWRMAMEQEDLFLDQGGLSLAPSLSADVSSDV